MFLATKTRCPSSSPSEAMKFSPGQKVRIIKQGVRYKGHSHIGKCGTVIHASEFGYHVIMDDTGVEATFFEDELEPV